MVKIVFPDDVEKELAAQQQQQQQKQHTQQSQPSQPASPPTSLSGNTTTLGEIQEPPKLTKAQLKEREVEIQKISSKLYTPESPLKEEYRSKSTEIEERLKRINERFAKLKLKEDAKNAELQRQAWLKYNHLAKPTLQDFKRPITSFLLFASAIYMTMQYSWFALERESYISQMQQKETELVNELNIALLEQQNVLTQYNESLKSKRWWKFW